MEAAFNFPQSGFSQDGTSVLTKLDGSANLELPTYCQAWEKWVIVQKTVPVAPSWQGFPSFG